MLPAGFRLAMDKKEKRTVLEQDWKRKEYESWDEAFRGLAPVIRQQSVRVAAYTQVIFTQACEDGFAADTEKGRQQINSKYTDLAYKCGMYHQLGKALVPPEYQIWSDDFTEEEAAVYRKYTTDGRTLIASLQESGLRAKEKRTGTPDYTDTDNIPWQMQRESCLQHMERYNGSGYPEGRRGDDISPIAQIVGIAKELDRLASETKSEDPFKEAFDVILEGKDILWSAQLVTVLQNCRGKCRNIYNKYVHYTLTLPKTIPLVNKRKERPMGLKYRPMVGDNDGTVVAYEAIPWFGGIAGRPGETEGAEELAEMFARTELTTDVTFYLLYEAADTVLRMQNCKLDTMGVLVQTLPRFFTRENHMQRFMQLFDDQPIDRKLLMLTVPAAEVVGGGKGMRTLLNRYIRSGITLVLDGYDPAKLSLEEIQEIGFTHIRFDHSLYMQESTANTMTSLRGLGFTLLGGGVEDTNVQRWLTACGVAAMSGPITGIIVEEDELIRDSLLQERK